MLRDVFTWLFASPRREDMASKTDARRARSANISDAPADPTNVADRDLVHRIRTGDEVAFEQLFNTYAPGLVTFVHGYVRDPGVAEELVQDVFLWIVRHREQWSVRGTLQSYLYSAARNYAMDHLRHTAVERRWEHQTLHASGGLYENMDPYAASSDRITQLEVAIARLPDTRRTTLALRWLHGLSYTEIAAVLGSSPKAVENQLNRTLRQLRTLLGA